MTSAKEHIITLLQKDKTLFQNEIAVKNLVLYNSYSNNSQREDSFIDFLIELKEISCNYLYKTYTFLEHNSQGKKSRSKMI